MLSPDMANISFLEQRTAVWERYEPVDDSIRAGTVIGIENKADLLLRGPRVRHEELNTGVHFKVGRGSLEVLRQIDTSSGEEVRFYNIYFTHPEGTVHYRSSGEKAEVSTTVSGKHDARQNEGLALLHLMREMQIAQEKHIRRDALVAKGKDKMQRAVTVFKRKDHDANSRDEVALAA